MPVLTGFLSKDAVIETAYVGSSYAFWLLVAAACMTSFYSWRLMFMTFYGESRAHGHGAGHGDAHGHGHDDHAHEPHESPLTMLIPLGVLALGAVFSGMLGVTLFGIFLTPVFYVLLRARRARRLGTMGTAVEASAVPAPAAGEGHA